MAIGDSAMHEELLEPRDCDLAEHVSSMRDVISPSTSPTTLSQLRTRSPRVRHYRLSLRALRCRQVNRLHAAVIPGSTPVIPGTLTPASCPGLERSVRIIEDWFRSPQLSGQIPRSKCEVLNC